MVKPVNTSNQVDDSLSDEALDWLVALNSGQATEADHVAFARWRDVSEEHARAAREADAIWHGLGLAGDDIRKVERKAKRARLTRRAVLGGGAAAVAGLALAASGIVAPRISADHVTAIAERRTVRLPDGSTALLNGGTALDVNYSSTQRQLTLFEGEALFTVVPDASRPFLVAANGGLARAVGTAFDVDMRPREVVVTVVEGRVDVTSPTNASSLITVMADQRVRYPRNGPVSEAESVDADAETAWRRGKLIFHRRPLGDVVGEIERHRSGRILVMGEELRRLEVSGVFDLDDPDAILNTIDDTLPVHITRLPFVTLIR